MVETISEGLYQALYDARTALNIHIEIIEKNKIKEEREDIKALYDETIMRKRHSLEVLREVGRTCHLIKESL